MARIKPFKALRPNVKVASRVAALPYDVYNRQEAKEAALKDELSFLNIDRAESQFDDSVDTYDECVYEMANKLFRDRINDGTYITDTKDCYYLYELIMDGRSQTGIVGCAHIDDYLNGIIKKHENTRADKEVDRIKHVDSLSAQTGPIFLAYKNNQVLKDIILKVKLEKPVYDFVSDDGITHRCWIIDNDNDITSIQDAFDKSGNIYIADGHHRCASAVKVGLKRREKYKNYPEDSEFNYFLSVLFDEAELKILDYNRVVKDLNNYTEQEILNKLNELGECIEADIIPYKPQNKGEVGIYLGNKWYCYKFSDEIKSNDPVKGLDVSILQDYILSPIFGIDDPKTDKRIDFIGGIRGLKELERRCSIDCKIAFSMFPTSITELFDVADANLLMPPKSTWFEPKLRSGLFIHEIER